MIWANGKAGEELQGLSQKWQAVSAEVQVLAALGVVFEAWRGTAWLTSWQEIVKLHFASLGA